MRSNNKSDFTWLKPNRRFIAQGLYLPSLYNPCLDEIAVVTDSSGSVSDEELTQSQNVSGLTARVLPQIFSTPNQKATQLTIVGNQTGATSTISITVNKTDQGSPGGGSNS